MQNIVKKTSHKRGPVTKEPHNAKYNRKDKPYQGPCNKTATQCKILYSKKDKPYQSPVTKGPHNAKYNKKDKPYQGPCNKTATQCKILYSKKDKPYRRPSIIKGHTMQNIVKKR
jgi:hypothetical protein